MRRLGIAVALCAIGSLTFIAPALAATPDEWRTEADEICERGSFVLLSLLSDAFPNGVPPVPSKDDLELLAATAAPAFQVQHDEIAGLERPAKLRKQIKKLLRTLQKSIDKIAKGARTGEIGAQELDDALVPAAEAAAKLGLESCGA
jgi:hypothetical protein